MGDTFKDRVLEEQRELGEKLIKLDEFINNNDVFKNLDATNQRLLIEQRDAMMAYYQLLSLRLLLIK